jgi:hypothetical protein
MSARDALRIVPRGTTGRPITTATRRRAYQPVSRHERSMLAADALGRALAMLEAGGRIRPVAVKDSGINCPRSAR